MMSPRGQTKPVHPMIFTFIAEVRSKLTNQPIFDETLRLTPGDGDRG